MAKIMDDLKVKFFTREEEAALVGQAMTALVEGGTDDATYVEVRNQLILSVWPIIRMKAKLVRHKYPKHELDDLSQVGLLAVVEKFPRFDQKMGYRLGCYLGQVAWKAMSDFARMEDLSIKLPDHFYSEKTALMAERARNVRQLILHRDDNCDLEPLDNELLARDDAEPADELDARERATKLAQALKELREDDPQGWTWLQAWSKDMTLARIGEVAGKSRQWVCKRIEGTLAKLRRQMGG